MNSTSIKVFVNLFISTYLGVGEKEDGILAFDPTFCIHRPQIFVKGRVVVAPH